MITERDVGLKSGHNVNISHSTLNSVDKAHTKAEAPRSRGLTRDTRATVEQVLDPRTMRILTKMKNRDVFEQFFACVSTGKEANVYQAARSQGRSPLAIKIFKTSILVFKDRSKYVDGDYRLRHGYAGNNPRKMVTQWAEKEARNLRRIASVGIRSPRPVDLRMHVLAMTFIGDKDNAAPRLLNAGITGRLARRAYIETVGLMRQMVQECKLVHGDLSEFNLLWHENHVYVIDVSQSVEFDHPMALDFLKRDCINVTRYFEKLISTGDLEELLGEVASDQDLPPQFDESKVMLSSDFNSEEETSTEYLHRMYWRPFTAKELYDFVLTPSKGETMAFKHSLNANIVGHKEIELPEGRGDWEVFVPSVDTLVQRGEEEEANLNNTKSKKNKRRKRDDSDSETDDLNAASVSAGQSVGVALDIETATKGAEMMRDLCASIQSWLEVNAVKKLHLTEEEEKEEEESELVFLETWKPTSLQDVGDLALLDAEFERRQNGDGERFIGHLMKKMNINDEDDEEDDEDEEDEEDDDAEEDEDEEDDEDEDEEDDEDGSDDDEDGSDDDDEEGGKKSRRKKGDTFDGNIPLGVSAKEWKKKVKEENREKRKEKIPKHLKKRFRKKASGRK